MHRPPRWRSALRTRQRARTTLNAKWFDAPTPIPGGVPAPVREDATTTPKIDDSEETPSKQHGE